MKHALRSLALTAALSAGMAAIAQIPYEVTVYGTVAGCTPNSFVNIETLPGTEPAQDIDVPVLPPTCSFSVTLNMISGSGGFIISTPCLGVMQSDTVLYEADPVLDSAMVYVVFNCGSTTPDCLGVPGGSALPGTPCTSTGGGNGIWNAECQCILTNGDCQACFTASQATDGNGAPIPFTAAFTNCSSGGTGSIEYIWDFPSTAITAFETSYTYNGPGVWGACLNMYADGCTSYLCDTVLFDANGMLVDGPVVYDCLQIPNGPNVPGAPCTNPATGASGTWSVNCECITNTTGCQAGFWVIQAYDSLGGEVAPIPYELWVWNLSSGTSPFQFEWDFGDGTGSFDPYPTHVYAQSGPYNLCLTLTDDAGCSSTYCDSISIDGGGFYEGMAPEAEVRNGFTIRVISQLPTGIADQPAFTDTRLWPNPVNDVLNLRFDTNLRGNLAMAVVDVNGRVVLSTGAMVTGGTNQLEVATSSLPAGMYMLRMGNGQDTMSFRFVKH